MTKTDEEKTRENPMEIIKKTKEMMYESLSEVIKDKAPSRLITDENDTYFLFYHSNKTARAMPFRVVVFKDRISFDAMLVSDAKDKLADVLAYFAREVNADKYQYRGIELYADSYSGDQNSSAMFVLRKDLYIDEIKKSEDIGEFFLDFVKNTRSIEGDVRRTARGMRKPVFDSDERETDEIAGGLAEKGLRLKRLQRNCLSQETANYTVFIEIRGGEIQLSSFFEVDAEAADPYLQERANKPNKYGFDFNQLMSTSGIVRIGKEMGLVDIDTLEKTFIALVKETKKVIREVNALAKASKQEREGNG